MQDDPNTLVSTVWLAAHLKDPDLRVLDGSWYLPQQGRDARAEYDAAHIPGARFFDIDDIAGIMPAALGGLQFARPVMGHVAEHDIGASEPQPAAGIDPLDRLESDFDAGQQLADRRCIGNWGPRCGSEPKNKSVKPGA